MDENTCLHMRLKNCLDTILYLERSMDDGYMRSSLHTDFSFLKACTKDLDRLFVEEKDVRRIERIVRKILLEVTSAQMSAPADRVIQ